MKQQQVQTLTVTFEGHAQQTENGVEYWLARDLQHLLGYGKWDNFASVISKAKTACEISGHAIADHFADVGKMVGLGSGSHNARTQQMTREQQISSEHVTNNQAVRQTLINRGIRPEQLPPAEDVKKVERRLASADKKSLKNPDTLGDGDTSNE